MLRSQTIGNLDNKFGRTAVPLGITTCRCCAASMGTAIGVHDLGAVVVKTVGTLFARTVAFETGIALGAYTNNISHFNIANGFRANPSGYANDFVSYYNGV